MTDDKEKLYDRILKMHRKAESAKQIGSEAEAMIFADAVQRMLIKHDLELTDIEYELEKKKDPVKMHAVPLRGKKRAVMWSGIIAKACAEAHFCAVIGIEKSDGVMIIGRRQHRMVAEFMIQTLVRLSDELAQKAYVKHYYRCLDEGDVTRARGFRDSFLMGISLRIAERYKNLTLETREQVTNKHAMIRLSSETAMVNAVLEKILSSDEVVHREQSIPKVDEQNIDGLVEGFEAGANVGLRANAIQAAETAPARRALPPGPTLLGGG